MNTRQNVFSATSIIVYNSYAYAKLFFSACVWFCVCKQCPRHTISYVIQSFSVIALLIISMILFWLLLLRKISFSFIALLIMSMIFFWLLLLRKLSLAPLPLVTDILCPLVPALRWVLLICSKWTFVLRSYRARNLSSSKKLPEFCESSRSFALCPLSAIPWRPRYEVLYTNSFSRNLLMLLF